MNIEKTIALFGIDNENKTSLSELENKVYEITKMQKQVSNWGLSPEVEGLVIKELKAQKKILNDIMHKEVDSLYE